MENNKAKRREGVDLIGDKVLFGLLETPCLAESGRCMARGEGGCHDNAGTMFWVIFGRSTASQSEIQVIAY